MLLYQMQQIATSTNYLRSTVLKPICTNRNNDSLSQQFLVVFRLH